MLLTPNLELRRFELEDAGGLYEVISAEGVFEYFPGELIANREMAVRMLGSIREHWVEYGFGLLAVVSRKTGALLGRCGLQYLPETEETEIDFVLHPAVWGNGYATEAARANLEYGFVTLGIEEIVGIVHPDNTASKRVLEKIGMTRNSRAEYFGMEVDHYSVRREHPEAHTPLR